MGLSCPEASRPKDAPYREGAKAGQWPPYKTEPRNFPQPKRKGRLNAERQRAYRERSK